MTEKNSKLLYLNTAQVKQICEKLDSVSILREIFVLHALGKTVLPEEAHLSWLNLKSESLRSLNMPAFLGGKYNIAGTKIINANIQNPERGFPRASGLTLLFDTDTARVITIMEGAYISSLRTASVSVLGIKLLRSTSPIRLGIIGLGVQGGMHLQLIAKYFTDIDSIFIYDNDLSKVKSIIAKNKEVQNKIVVASSAKEAVVSSNVIITATTATKGYIKADWINLGSLVIHVSLDDLLPEAIKKANKLIVDDWNLIKSDNKRIFGKMYRDGLLSAPSSKKGEKPYIYAELGDIVAKKKKGRESQREIIIFNPFGLAIEDVGIAYHVYKNAKSKGKGTYLAR